jgi:hypothetical protein
LLNMLYIWISSHHSVNVFTYADFLNLFSIRSYYGHSCILHVYQGCTPLRFINELTLLIKRKMVLARMTSPFPNS